MIAFFGHSYGRPVQSIPLSESEMTFVSNLLNTYPMTSNLNKNEKKK